MDKYQCERCGKCCFMFNQKERPIRFLPEEPLIVMAASAIHNLKNPLLAIFHRVKEDFKQTIKGKTYFIVPTIAEIQPFLHHGEKTLIPYLYPDNDAFDCMFLQRLSSSQEQGDITLCKIHGFHPKMCRDYPTSKGNVCLNHLERRYTREFYTYQRNKIGFAIAPLKSLFRSVFTNPSAAEILTILMDFGTFSVYQLREFFSAEFHVDPLIFNSTLQELGSQSLVRMTGDVVTGISLKEVENLIDRYMLEKGWSLPSKI